MTSIILLSGILGFGFSPDAFATHNDNGKGLAEGCDKKNDNGNTENNPHCASEPTFNICDTDMSGDITRAEVSAFTGLTGIDLDIVMLTATGDVNGIIDTQVELAALNGSIEPDCI